MIRSTTPRRPLCTYFICSIPNERAYDDSIHTTSVLIDCKNRRIFVLLPTFVICAICSWTLVLLARRESKHDKRICVSCMAFLAVSFSTLLHYNQFTVNKTQRFGIWHSYDPMKYEYSYLKTTCGMLSYTK